MRPLNLCSHGPGASGDSPRLEDSAGQHPSHTACGAWGAAVALWALVLSGGSLHAQTGGKTTPQPGDIHINAHGTRFRYCPPGDFTMGSSAAERKAFEQNSAILWRETPHRVRLTQGFWIAEAETSQREWKTVFGADAILKLRARWMALGMRMESGGVPPLHGEPDSGSVVETTDFHPMYWVSWEDALEYCSTLTEWEHRTGSLPPQWKYSLPTEAQWEYACRTGRGRESDPPVERVPFDFDPQKKVPDLPRKCGTQTPNKWGIRDLLGNVAEWCLDWFGEYPSAGSGPVVDPLGPSEGIDRVVRGGSHNDEQTDSDHEFLRGASRSGLGPNLPCGFIGFRAVLVPASEDAPTLEFIPADRGRPPREKPKPVSSAPDAPEIEKLQTTLRAYVQSWASNDPRDEASFYDDVVRWRYAKSPTGNASRAEILNGIRGKITAYPRRAYKSIQILDLEPQSAASAKAHLLYDYEYAGKKNARGNTEITLRLEHKAGAWKITDWDEKVSRN